MRSKIMAVLALTSVAMFSGCAAIKGGIAHVESVAKTPPQTVMDALHVLLNFGESLIGVLFQFVFHGLTGL